MTVIVDQGEHPSNGKGRPSCSSCHGSGVVVVADCARGRLAGMKFPGAFKCGCVDAYQEKLRRRARSVLQKHPRDEIDVADLVELQELADHDKGEGP